MMPMIDFTQFEQWLPEDTEKKLTERLLQVQTGLTRRRAQCFIRLWVYFMLKQQKDLTPDTVVNTLEPVPGSVSCTHREAAELFYAGTDKGGDRAAGMMIDQLVKIGLVEKNFDGNTLILRLRSIPELLQNGKTESFTTYPDHFNPRKDTILVANCIAQSYSWLTPDMGATAGKITKLLRQWAQEYPKGMRVLRRQDNQQAIGFYMLFPVASVSEENFFRPPSSSLYLSTVSEDDPITMAVPGDLDCLTVFVRSWKIDPQYINRDNVCQFLEDSKMTLTRIKEDFPNICDLYALPIHPSDEYLASMLGFQKTVQDPQSFLYWIYMALDQFLELDLEQAIAPFQSHPDQDTL